jgi:hypothetical protein
MGSCVRDAIEELSQLAVALLDAANRASREEAITQVAHGALDAALLLRLSHTAEPRLDVQRAGQLEQPGMEANGIAVALEHDDLRIVKEPLPGRSPEE